MNPTFAKIGDGYRFEWAEDAITIELERIRERDGELKAGIVIRSQRMPNPGLLHDASLNLGSSSTQRTLAKVLEEREPGLDWYGKITQIAYLTKERWREGEPLTDLSTVDFKARPRWLLEPFLSYGGPTVLFADGGCVSGDTILEGENECFDVLADRGLPVTVWALGREGPVLTQATAPFLKGKAELYRFETADGKGITVTAEHRFLTDLGWRFAESVSVGDLVCVEPPQGFAAFHPGSRLGNALQALRPDALCSKRIAEGSQAHYWPDRRQCDRLPLEVLGSGQAGIPSLAGALERTRCAYSGDDQLLSPIHNHPGLKSSRPSKNDSCSCGPWLEGAEFRALSYSAKPRLLNSLGCQRSLAATSPGMLVVECPQQEEQTPSAYQFSPFTLPPLHSLKYSTVTAIRKVGRGPYYDLHVPGFENYRANGIWHHNSGKSIFALALARSVACGRPIVTKKPAAERAAVLYLDWETDASTHSERMAAICAGQGCSPCDDPCPIYYRREAASLYESAQGLRRKIAELNVGLVVVDSLGAARGGDPNSAEITILTFNAIRSWDVPTLIVDHVTKAAGSDSTKPYGSVYSYNLARMTWGITKAQEAGERRSTIALTNWKNNNGRLLSRLGYELNFVGDEESDELMMVGFTPRDVRDDPVLSRSLPLKDQIAGVIRSNKGEAMAPSVIAEVLTSEGVEASTDTVRTTLNRYRGHIFAPVGPGRWGLLARV